jgi:hypothetical protein
MRTRLFNAIVVFSTAIAAPGIVGCADNGKPASGGVLASDAVGVPHSTPTKPRSDAGADAGDAGDAGETVDAAAAADADAGAIDATADASDAGDTDAEPGDAASDAAEATDAMDMGDGMMDDAEAHDAAIEIDAGWPPTK